MASIAMVNTSTSSTKEKIMSSPNEISSLQKIMVKPAQWRITQSPDKTYQLEFTYRKTTELAEFAHVLTRRGQTKIYKSEKAIINDIAKVQKEALIHAIFNT